MSNRKRASLGLDDEKEQIDLEELTGVTHRVPPTDAQQQQFMEAGAARGFVSREPPQRRRRRRSPYTAQFGGKCREGMKSLFQDVAERLDLRDTQALEEAILALIEKEGFDDLKQRYEDLVE